jgi:hypothetical protein
MDYVLNYEDFRKAYTEVQKERYKEFSDGDSDKAWDTLIEKAEEAQKRACGELT